MTGRNDVEHMANLETVLKRLNDNGLKLRKSKCTFMEPSVTYLGHCVDKDGIHPTEEKTKAITESQTPTNVNELTSFLGLLNYYHKFLPNLSTALSPLYLLLNNGSEFKWGKAQEKAFFSAKNLLKSSNLLVHYNPDLPLVLCSDASPVGIGSVLSHVLPDGSERPIAYASRTLTPAEKNYSQVEKEGLGVIFGVKYFHKYIFGRKITIYTDHKPLLGLFHSSKVTSNMAPPRIVRWSLLLSAYNYILKYKPGKDISNADALSRLPCSVPEFQVPEPPETILSLSLLRNSSKNPISSNKVANYTRTDPVLSKVSSFVLGLQSWPSLDVNDDLKPYFNRKDELSIEKGCLLFGSRVVIPPAIRSAVLDELHNTHPGIVRMKNLSRSYVWWPKLDLDIENTVKRCHTCQIHGNKTRKSELLPWSWPVNPWDRIHIDFAGPVENKMILVIVDAGSKYMDTHVMNNATSERTIQCLRHTFALLGLPRYIVSDNGTAFTSDKFQLFCDNNGIKHIRCAPYHPASNGLAERAVQTLKNAIKKNTDGSLETRLYRFLLNYHKTPHATTGCAPSEMIMKRLLRSRLDLLKPNLQEDIMDKQIKMKFRHDKTAVKKSFDVNDYVYAYDKVNFPKWKRGQIVQQDGPLTFTVELSDGRRWRRHADHLKPRHPVPATHDAAPDYSSAQLSQLSPPMPPYLATRNYDLVPPDRGVRTDTPVTHDAPLVAASASSAAAQEMSAHGLSTAVADGKRGTPGTPAESGTPPRRSKRVPKKPIRLDV